MCVFNSLLKSVSKMKHNRPRLIKSFISSSIPVVNPVCFSPLFTHMDNRTVSFSLFLPPQLLQYCCDCLSFDLTARVLIPVELKGLTPASQQMLGGPCWEPSPLDSAVPPLFVPTSLNPPAVGPQRRRDMRPPRLLLCRRSSVH